MRSYLQFAVMCSDAFEDHRFKTLDEYPGIRIYRHGIVIGVKGKPIGRKMGGYLHCWISIQGIPKNVILHRMVARAFVVNPRPDIFIFVDHIDENKLNNCASNLRWCCKTINQLNTYPRKCKARDGLSKPYRAKVHLQGNDKQHSVYSEYFPTQLDALEAMYQKKQEIIADLYYHLTRPFTGAESKYYRIYKSRM